MDLHSYAGLQCCLQEFWLNNTGKWFSAIHKSSPLTFATKNGLFWLPINANDLFSMVLEFRKQIYIPNNIWNDISNISGWANPKNWFSTSSWDISGHICNKSLIICITNKYKWLCSLVILVEMWIHIRVTIYNHTWQDFA